MKIKFKPKKIIKIFIMTSLLNSSLILSQSIKYNTIKEISTMEEIHDEIFNNSEATTNNIKTITDNNDNEDKNKTFISDKIEGSHIQEKKEDRFEEINDKTNRVTALGSAMGAVDLGSTPDKKIRFGAGVGNSSSSQAIAVGVGYAPTDRFRINTKFSSSTNNMNNNSISVGVSYDLDL